MKKSNEDMLGLVNALLEVYKYEAGKIELCKTNFEINELLKNCVQQLESLAISQEISIQTEFRTQNNLSIFADKNELRRVIINLLGIIIKGDIYGYKRTKKRIRKTKRRNR
jgi:signal transduction histidine kinase